MKLKRRRPCLTSLTMSRSTGAYATLGVSNDATTDEIRAAYSKKAATLHPDHGGSPFTWADIQRAYDVLMDEGSRAAHDEAEHIANGEAEEDGGYEDDPWYADLSVEPFDLHAALHVVAAEEGATHGGDSRLFSCFHTFAKRAWDSVVASQAYEESQPDDDVQDEVLTSFDEEAYRSAVIRFRRMCLALIILRDPERRRIYSSGGYDGLVASEAFQEESVFEIDAFRVFQAFYRGEDAASGREDPEVRQFLLLRADDREEEKTHEAGAKDVVDDLHEEDEEGEEDEEVDDSTHGVAPEPDGSFEHRRRMLLAQPPPAPPPGLLESFDNVDEDDEMEGADLNDEVWHEMSGKTRGHARARRRVHKRHHPLATLWWRRLCSRRHARSKRVV